MQDYEKTYAATLAVVVLLAAIILLGVFCTTQEIAEYPSCGIVESLDRENDTVTIVDASGNLWEFYGCEDWFVGDIAAVTFRDTGTPGNIYDDEIVAVRYIGYVEEE